jgi:RHS repeat-associated protein
VYRFSSKELHVNSGLYYYGYRWYHPNLQRWLNRDPLEERGGINLYRFVRNRPVDLSDPWGEQTNPPVIFPPIPPYPPEVPPPLTPEEIERMKQQVLDQAISQIQSNWNSLPYSCQHHASLDAYKTQGGLNNTGNGLPANMSTTCSPSEINTPRRMQNTTMTCPDGKTVVKCITFERCDKNIAGTGQSWQPHKTCGTCPDGSKVNY